MEILYHDEDIVVCIKPRGVLSARDASGKSNMMDLISDKLCCENVYPIHRLDREVSGVMIFALSEVAAARLSKDAQDCNRFIKEYIAVVQGHPAESRAVLEDFLFKDSSKNKSFVVLKERKGVKKAKLEYSIINQTEIYSVVRVRLFTGRTHQIRVQFASRKMPIFGDRKYGGSPHPDGIQLFSVRLSFSHPISGEELNFEKIPECLKEYNYE